MGAGGPVVVVRLGIASNEHSSQQVPAWRLNGKHSREKDVALSEPAVATK